MKQTRKKHNAEFKAKVALEAIQGEFTVSKLAAKYQLHPQQINRWEKTLMEEAVKVFAGGEAAKGDGSPELVAELYKKIGKLEVESDFFRQGAQSLTREERERLVARTGTLTLSNCWAYMPV